MNQSPFAGNSTIKIKMLPLTKQREHFALYLVGLQPVVSAQLLQGPLPVPSRKRPHAPATDDPVMRYLCSFHFLLESSASTSITACVPSLPRFRSCSMR